LECFIAERPSQSYGLDSNNILLQRINPEKKHNAMLGWLLAKSQKKQFHTHQQNSATGLSLKNKRSVTRLYCSGPVMAEGHLKQ
jgi:hypothetical protein